MSAPGSPHFGAAEHRLEEVVGTLLRLGVVIAATVATIGGLVYLARHWWEPASYGVFRGEPAGLRSIGGVVRATLEGEGRGVIQLGLLLLIATPIARVALTLVAFARLGDRHYVVITGIVLGVLLFSLLGVRA